MRNNTLMPKKRKYNIIDLFAGGEGCLSVVDREATEKNNTLKNKRGNKNHYISLYGRI